MTTDSILSCTLPNNHVLKARRTGVFKQARALVPGSLFCFEDQIWEALPGSNANLSNFDDEGEVIGVVKVEVLKEVK